MPDPAPAPSPTSGDAGPQLPNLLVIGAMKCGTTSLHEYLALHPEIFMSALKEPDFFVGKETWEWGLDWYRAQFAAWEKIRGESSQNYTKCHLMGGVPERIHGIIPGAKLLYVVRDPVDRMLSHFYENVESQQEPNRDLNAYLAEFEGNHYIQTSQYFMQLEAYLKLFPREQILVVDSDALRNQRLETMNGIFDFLGVSRISDPSLFEFRANTRASKKVPTVISRLAKGGASAGLRRLLPRRLKDRIAGSTIFQRLAYRKMARPEIDPELADRIREYLKPDVEALREFTGQPFSGWSL